MEKNIIFIIVYVGSCILNGIIWFYCSRKLGDDLVKAVLQAAILPFFLPVVFIVFETGLIWLFYGTFRGWSWYQTSELFQEWGGVPLFVVNLVLPTIYILWGYRMWRRHLGMDV